MTVSEFNLQVRPQPGVTVLDLEGEINGLAEKALSSGYTEAEGTGADTILLNFARVDYINSTGIALIVSLLARARATHRRLLACGLSDHYVEIFNITRLADFMTVFSDEASALSGAATNGAAQFNQDGSRTA